MITKKDYSIETLRGIAIVLLVTHHVIGNPNSGLRLPNNSLLHYLDESLEFLRLPLFTVISGYIYCLSPVKLGKQKDFMMRKLRRLIYPLFTVAPITYIFQALAPGTNNPRKISEIYTIFTSNYIHFWYLKALFLLFLIIVLLEGLDVLKQKSKWLLILSISFLISFAFYELLPSNWGKGTDLVSIKNCFYLLPFFLLGLGIKRFDITNHKGVIAFAFIVFILGIIVQQLELMGLIDKYSLASRASRSALGSITGACGNIIFFRYRKSVNSLAWIGGYAFSIYLFHMFGIGGSRVLLKILGINYTLVSLLMGVIISVTVSIIIHIILDKYHITRVYFLGESPKKKAPSSDNS
jgi:peptidoglycan/LPS O-acetylase OafA/YrhL